MSEAYEEELHELDRDGYYNNCRALESVLPGTPWDVIRYRYSQLCAAVYNKLKGLRLDAEKQLIVESRAMLTGYDDFMFGLKANQALYQEQERLYQGKLAQLQNNYNAAVQQLLAMAQEQGVVLRLPDAPLLLADSGSAD